MKVKGRPAAQPPNGWTPDSSSAGLTSVEVRLHLEDASDFVFRLDDPATPERIRAQIVAGVAAHCASEKGWRRIESVDGGRRGIAALLRWIKKWNKTHPNAQVEDLADLTPFHVRAFHEFLGKERTRFRRPLTEASKGSYIGKLRRVIGAHPDLPPETRRELMKRRKHKRPTTKIERYSEEEFRAIRNAARRVVISAHERVAESLRMMDATGDEASLVRSRALREVLRDGQPSTMQGFESLRARGSKTYCSATRARAWLFLTAEEILAAAVVLASRRGLNLAPISTMVLPIEHGRELVQLDLDKPRRGPSARFWPELVADDEGAMEPGDAAIVTMIAEATQPARDHLASRGTPTDRLLVSWSPGKKVPELGLTRKRKPRWLPKGVSLDFRRLRRSVTGGGVAKEPTNHSPQTYLYYVRTDPASLAERQAEAAAGIQQAADRARGEVHVKLLENDEAKNENDALIVNCSDPEVHPITQRPCTSGFYSFLDCLGCGNAATTARLLPAQLATLRVLEELRGALTDVWEVRFARSYLTLQAMVGRHTAAEVAVAEPRVADHIPRVMAALRLEMPA